MKQKKYQVVEVKWVDSASRDRWHELSDDDKPSEIRTVGFMVRKAKSHITVCHSYDEDGNDIIAAISIPRGCINSIKRLSCSDG